MIPIKYIQGDKVFFLEDNKIKEGEIYSGYSIFNTLQDYRNYYYIRHEKNIKDAPYKEDLLFKTREELAEKA